ncbi:acetyltransferase [Nibribacter ruber]|uniref:Acetyltransferase n=1 Tax=Nibribacter ruber TaxID=2698458 RepID=A0A6P1P1M2_9BACT|nr:acetyltransferase [Nibribacter ruber]QHL87482.1 acetyltransferase [Nibribacter ruber]
MNSTGKDIVIVGAGGLGREVLMLIRQINQHTPTWNFLGFYDDASPEAGFGYPYLGTVDDLNNTPTPLHAVIAIGDCQAKAKVVERLFNNFLLFPVLVHPSVVNEVVQLNQIDEGSIICQNCILTINVRLGKHVLLNLACTLGHDAVLGDFCSLMPQVAVSGGVTLQKGVYMGTNSSILQYKSVGVFTAIGAGAVVTQDLPDHCTAVGVPARIIKQAV